MASIVPSSFALGKELDEKGHWRSRHFQGFFHEKEITDELKGEWEAKAEAFPSRRKD
jgi:hypothetical protein